MERHTSLIHPTEKRFFNAILIRRRARPHSPSPMPESLLQHDSELTPLHFLSANEFYDIHLKHHFEKPNTPKPPKVRREPRRPGLEKKTEGIRKVATKGKEGIKRWVGEQMKKVGKGMWHLTEKANGHDKSVLNAIYYNPHTYAEEMQHELSSALNFGLKGNRGIHKIYDTGKFTAQTVGFVLGYALMPTIVFGPIPTLIINIWNTANALIGEKNRHKATMYAGFTLANVAISYLPVALATAAILAPMLAPVLIPTAAAASFAGFILGNLTNTYYLELFSIAQLYSFSQSNLKIANQILSQEGDSPRKKLVKQMLTQAVIKQAKLSGQPTEGSLTRAKQDITHALIQTRDKLVQRIEKLRVKEQNIDNRYKRWWPITRPLHFANKLMNGKGLSHLEHQEHIINGLLTLLPYIAET